MRLPFVLGLSLPLIGFSAVDPDKDVWLVADFDSPIRINGKIYDQKVNPEGYASGRFGRGYEFFRETNNRLPPMATFLSDASSFVGEGLSVREDVLSFSGGEFQVAPRPTGIAYDHVGFEAGDTWSFFVKGRKGTSVTVWPELTALGDKDLADLRKNKNLNYTDKNVQSDTCVTNSVKLTGEWQRISCLARMDSRSAGKRMVSLHVKTDAPVEMKRFQLQVTGVFPAKGLFHPGRWVDGGRSAQGTVLQCADPKVIRTFPYKSGSCSFWMRASENVPRDVPLNLWSLNSQWAGAQWGLCASFFKTGERGQMTWLKRPLGRTEKWSHVATVWSEERIATYVDGICVGEVRADAKKGAKLALVPQKNGNGTLRIGAFGDGSGPTDAVMDDFVIFNRALTEDEVRGLAAASDGVDGKRGLVLTDDPEFRVFYRNQREAAIRHAVWSSRAGDYTLSFEFAGRTEPPRTVRLPAGAGELPLPFEPSYVRSGRHGYAFRLSDGDGKTVLSYQGEVVIHSRLDDQGFVFHSWGGIKPVSPTFGSLVGINCYNIGRDERLRLRGSAERGDFLSIRYANKEAWRQTDFDLSAVREQVRDDLRFARGLPMWRMLLLNSEMYTTGWALQAKDSDRYRALAKADLGCDPDFAFHTDPDEISGKSLKGVIGRRDCPALATLEWVQEKGMPLLLTNRETTKEVHALKGDVTVWSEPFVPLSIGLAGTVDMGADWIYQYSTQTTLYELRSQYAACRRFGKPYMPTLGGCYWPTINGQHPVCRNKDGKPQSVKMGQGADEVVIKTWMALGAVPAHSLSFYELDTWEQGVSNALKFAASPSCALETIAEPDVGERYGRAWREDLAPAAELLRDMPNERAKVALLFTPESRYAGGFWWGHHWYSVAIMGAFASQAPSFDYFAGDEATADVLAQYKYVFLPMSRVIYRDRAKTLAEVARRGVTIVQDAYATNHYPNEVWLKDVKYLQGQPDRMKKQILSWYGGKAKELQELAGACSTCDGTNGFTFVKSYKGARYVVVVNDARDPKPSYLNRFKTNDWYRVTGAACRIGTTIREVPRGGEVCLFNAHGRKPGMKRMGDDVLCLDEFSPAEGRVYCVYPLALKSPELSIEGDAKAGRRVTLVVRIRDKSGRPAPGRQVVGLRLVDGEGAVRDESGRYAVEDGVVRIPIGFVLNEREAGFFSQWRAEVTDLTTGRSSVLKFKVVK